jgi:hypothetical protein
MRVKAWTKTNFDHTIIQSSGVIIYGNKLCASWPQKQIPPAARGAAGGAFSPIDLAIDWALFELAAANDVPPSEFFSDWYRARAASVDAASWFQIRAWRLLGKGLAPTDAQREW